MIDWAVYLKQGLIKKQAPNFRQIEKQILRAQKDLKTFHLVEKDDPEWASAIAYQAMLRMGRALLFSCGYLPVERRQHKTVVEATGKILGPKFSLVINYFDRLRRKRNIFFYDSEDSRNFTEAKKAIEVAAELLYEIRNKIKALNSQKEFKF
jgi:uncharacterized protein (UPF0332 family)